MSYLMLREKDCDEILKIYHRIYPNRPEISREELRLSIDRKIGSGLFKDIFSIPYEDLPLYINSVTTPRIGWEEYYKFYDEIIKYRLKAGI